MSGVTKFLLWIYVSDAALELKQSWYIHTRVPWVSGTGFQCHNPELSLPTFSQLLPVLCIP